MERKEEEERKYCASLYDVNDGDGLQISMELVKFRLG